MLQPSAEVEYFKLIIVTQKDHQLLGTLRDIVFLAMFGHKAIDFYRRNMKHIRCYDCNKFGN